MTGKTVYQVTLQQSSQGLYNATIITPATAETMEYIGEIQQMECTPVMGGSGTVTGFQIVNRTLKVYQ